jgi:ubiquinone biosynthesis protein
MKRSRIDRMRESLRLQQVYNVLMRYGMDFVFDRGMMGEFRRFMQEWIYDLPAPLDPLRAPVKMRLLLQELGPTYVKMGQIISSRSAVLPEDWAVELDKLQSNVPPFLTEDAYQIIQEELGAPVAELFATFTPQPLAAASTAQVHRATLHTGEEVVVKVQRPDIRQQMKADIGIMQNFAVVLERRVEWAQNIDLRGMLDEFGRNILEELDYRGEAYNAVRLGAGLAPIEGISVPQIYLEYSTSKVLTMEFIRGVKLNDVAAIDVAGLNRLDLATTSLRGMIKQMLIDGFFHADPHPGNILLDLSTGMIYMIDVGMVGELSIQNRLNLINLLIVLQNMDAHGLAQVTLNITTPFRKDFDEKAYYKDFERTVTRLLTFSSEFSTAVTAVFDVLERHGLRMDADLTMALKAMTQAEAIAKSLAPEVGFVPIAREVVQELAIEQITAENVTNVLKKEVNSTLREVSKRIPTLQSATLKWLTQYEKGRFELHLDFSDLEDSLIKARQSVWHIVIGIMLVGMIIGSAIATSVTIATGTSLDTILPQVAYFGYVGSMIIASIYVLVLLWRLFKGEGRRN